MSLTTPLSVQKLQTALHDKAKGSPNFRFYAQYDKVYREDVMAFAYECCKANRGAAGVDGQTFEDIEEYGVKKWLDELTQELKSRTYRQPVRRVYIPKPDGKQRPLGVPAIRDRVAQSAAVLVLEPIFEADLQPEQYAYRADRSALDAVRHVHKLLITGHGQIVDADLSGYFDSIPHADLLKSAARRIVDGAMLHLIKMWGHALWQAPNRQRLKGKRDRALLALLLACGLRRQEAVTLTFDHLQQREEHWAIVDLVGKGGHVRTVPVPDWVRTELDDWLAAAAIDRGKLFRGVNKVGRAWGDGMTVKAVWHIGKESAKSIGVAKLAPHDLRRTCARLCHASGGELEQIQFLLGQVSLQTTERYLGCKQRIQSAVNDRIGIEPKP